MIYFKDLLFATVRSISLTSKLAPSICVGIYGGFLSLIYWNIPLSSFINSILCSKSSATVWLHSKVAVLPWVTYCGAINCTFMWSASVASGNREITVRIYYRVTTETSWTLSTTSNMVIYWIVLIQNCEYTGINSSVRENCRAQLRNDFTSFF